MSGPPPPPPSAPPPPLPNFNTKTAPNSKGAPDMRNALLKSIEKGTRLKKTVTNDRSAPIVGKTTASNNNSSISKPTNTQNGAQTSISSGSTGFGPLGGLFADGMPKLRATGKLGISDARAAQLDQNTHISAPKPVLNRHNSTPKSPIVPKPFDHIQSQLKQQLATNDNRNRGPPPPAPIRNMSDLNGLQKSNNSNNLPQRNKSSLHSSRSNSNLNIDTIDTSLTQSRHVVNHGKPNLAPKPPGPTGTLPNKPRKLSTNGLQVNRAQSMRSPRSPSPPSTPNGGQRPELRPKLTSMRPAVPPPNIPPHLALKQSVRAPNHAPPPPPSAPQHAPPPPPHRAPRQPPAPPNVVQQGVHNPPAPPPRLSSMSRGTDLDDLFKKHFKSLNEFPNPPKFTKCRKVYSNRQAV